MATSESLVEHEIRSESVFSGKLLKVYRDEVRLPDGSPSVREWINHPGAAAVVPILPDGSTLLVRQFRYPARQTFLEVPAGKFDRPGEDPYDLAMRELAEETGCKAVNLIALGSFYPCIGYSSEQIYVFLAEGVECGAQDLDEGEFIELVPIPFVEAVSMAREGKLQDAKTALALLMADAYLSNRDNARAED